MTDELTITREDRVEAFRQKNARRRQGRHHGNFSSKQRTEARRLRQVCSGRFGKRKAHAFNERIPGTLGDFRDENDKKKSEEVAPLLNNEEVEIS